MKIYMIRNRQTGQYSSGGINPRWGKVGKIWSKSSYVKTHLRQLARNNLSNHIYQNAEIVEIERTEVEISKQDVISKIHDILAEDFDAQEKRKEKRKETTGGGRCYRRITSIIP